MFTAVTSCGTHQYRPSVDDVLRLGNPPPLPLSIAAASVLHRALARTHEALEGQPASTDAPSPTRFALLQRERGPVRPRLSHPPHTWEGVYARTRRATLRGNSRQGLSARDTNCIVVT